jgi:hypothetical protein
MHFYIASESIMGRKTWNVVPLFTLLLTLMIPPIWLIVFLTLASPKPFVGEVFFVEKLLLKILFKSDFWMPHPSSINSMRQHLSGAASFLSLGISGQ